MSSISLRTLGDLIENRHRLYICCEASPGGRRCNHDALVYLEQLAVRLGRDHGCLHDDLVGKFRCARCGSKAISLRIHPPTTTDVWSGERV
ncbi:MAG: hypothetical protein AB7P12_16195 [Alphaproteobacteria bacterium]